MANQARSVALWESSEDLLSLSKNGFNFQFAKSVIGPDGQLTFNLVWQSQVLAPRTTITWTPVYGLNWSLQMPQAGITVTLGGVWQPCAIGASYDISKVGLFVPSQIPGKKDYMNIGKNNYTYPGVDGIHIIVGVQNSSGGFDSVYIDPIALGLNMNAYYQPQEKVEWWYEAGNLSATMISGAGTVVDDYDMSAPNPVTGKFYTSTTYVYQAGAWKNSPDVPPPNRVLSRRATEGSLNLKKKLDKDSE